tara:strand:- start:2379 stop:2741 length:363 start_codon:yes stop_codon:yes gene_type:complete
VGFWQKLWRGEVSLSFTFWRMGIMTYLALAAFNYLLGMLGYYKEITDFKNFQIWVFSIAVIIYMMFILICIWRSAGKYIASANAKDTTATWGYCARGAVVIGWLAVLNMLFLFYVAHTGL